jgi:hypothetical protein
VTVAGSWTSNSIVPVTTAGVFVLLVMASQHVACAQDLASLVHFTAAADIFTVLPVPHMAFVHDATGVQQLVTPASAPRALAALAVSWYLPAPHATLELPHL